MPEAAMPGGAPPAETSAAGNPDAADEGALLQQAAVLQQAERWDEAAAVFQLVLEFRPQSFGALAGLGHLARARGDRAAALAAFEAARAAYPDNADLAFEAAIELTALGRLDEARAIYLHTEAPKRQFDALVALAHLARRQEGRAASLALFRQAAALRPDHAGVHLEIAGDLTALGRADEAEAALRQVVAADPRNTGVHVRLGQLARRRRDRGAAMAHFGAALAADPGNTAIRLEVAAELRDAGRIAEARQILRHIAATAPDGLAALLEMGNLERLAGNRAAALAALRQAVQRHPQNATALVECAIEERVAGNPDVSRQLLEQALALAPDNLHTILQLAEHAWLADDAPRALELCEMAVKAHPAHPAAYAQAARALTALGRLEDGLAMLEEGERRCGPHPEIAAKRAELLRQLGRWDAAQAALAGDVADSAGHFGLWRQRAELLLALGDFAACEQALAVAPAGSRHEEAHVWQLRGELAAARWDLAAAGLHLAKATGLHPSNGWAFWLRARNCLLQADMDGAVQHLAESVRLDAAALRLRRKSPNISQSLLGQILDEYRIDTGLTARLAALAAQPAAERVAPLLETVRAVPGSTAPAASLLIALRQAGLFAGPQPGAAAAIPARIAQYWDTAEPPEDIAALMAGWQVLHPEHAYTRFSDATARAFLAARYGTPVQLAYRRAAEPAQKADIFRLAWLYAEGGVYADADDRCVGPVTALFAPGAGFAAYQEEYGTLGNNFLAAAPRHPVTGAALAAAVAAVNRGDLDIAWLATGPGLLTREFAATLAASPLRPEAFLADCVILERHHLRRAVAAHAATAYKQTSRHWLRTAFPGGGKAPQPGKESAA